jgi:hypothetical protein
MILFTGTSLDASPFIDEDATVSLLADIAFLSFLTVFACDQ